MRSLRAQGSLEAIDDLYSLVEGPDDRYTRWTSCIVNGIRFHCKERDDNLKTQNSGVSVFGNHNGEDIDFYGVLEEVLELSYILDRKLILFRCRWFNTNKR